MSNKEKVVIISGACGGIGKAVTKKFYDNGYTIAMCDINEVAMNAAISELGLDSAKVSTYVIDISDELQVKNTIDKIVAEYGSIDSLINIAAIIGQYNPVADFSMDMFKKIYSINVFGTFAMMKNVLPTMLNQKCGNIVNFGSVSGMTGYTYEVGYGSSKWAVIGMTKTVANEYGKYGIRCNSISPGWVNTGMLKKSIEDYKQWGDSEITYGPLGRPAEPAEIADIVYVLCQPESKVINGSNVLADGGMMLG